MPSVPTRMDLEPSKALSIAANPPQTFAGRKVGALVTDGLTGRFWKVWKRR